MNRPAFVLALVLVAAGAGRAAAVPPARLTADEIARRAAVADPGLVPREAELQAAEAVVRPEPWRNPELRLRYNRNDRTIFEPDLPATPDVTVPGSVDEGYDEYEVALRVFVPHPVARRGERAGREAAVRRARARVDEVRGDAAGMAFRLAAELLYWQDREAALARRAALRDRAAQWAREHGLVADIVDAEARHLEAVADGNEAAARRAGVGQDLLDLIGGDPAAGLVVEPGSLADWMKTSDEDWTTRHAGRSSAIAAESRARAEESAAAAAAARGARWPWLEFIEFGYGEEDRFEESEVWSVFAGISLPVFAWASDPGRGEAAAALAYRLRADDIDEAANRSLARALQAARAAESEYRRREAEATAARDRIRARLREDEQSRGLTELQRLRAEESLVEADLGLLEVRRERDARAARFLAGVMP